MKRKKTPAKITLNVLRKLTKAVERKLGLQKINVGSGAHKQPKDRPRKNTIDVRSID